VRTPWSFLSGIRSRSKRSKKEKTGGGGEEVVDPLATTVALVAPAAAADKAECRTMVGDRMITLWLETDDATQTLKVTNEKGETVSYGRDPTRMFDPQLMLIYSMVHNNQCKLL
jgi:hypothetical protein